MNTIQDSTNSLTRHKPANKFRMHQNDKSPKATKTIISFDTILDSLLRIGRGTGTFSDMITMTSTLKFCESRLELDKELGFKEDLVNIRNSLSKIIYRANPSKEIDVHNWNCPFLTIEEQTDIEKLVFLVEYQYTNSPTLNPNISLDTHYRRFTFESQEEL